MPSHTILLLILTSFSPFYHLYVITTSIGKLFVSELFHLIISVVRFIPPFTTFAMSAIQFHYVSLHIRLICFLYDSYCLFVSITQVPGTMPYLATSFHSYQSCKGFRVDGCWLKVVMGTRDASRLR